MAIRLPEADLIPLQGEKARSPTRLPIRCQERPPNKSFWCWVACTKMVLDELLRRQGKQSPRPCSIASSHFTDHRNCCTTGRCDEGLDRSLFEEFLEKFLANVTHVGAKLAAVDVGREITHKKSPLIVAWTNPNHYLVVADITQGLVDICDPEPSGYSGTIPFSQLENATFSGSATTRVWVDTWIDLWR